MNNDDGVQTDEQPQTRRGRKRTRRNYARELQATESRIEAALRVLRRAAGPKPGTLEANVVGELILIAIETLEGR